MKVVVKTVAAGSNRGRFGEGSVPFCKSDHGLHPAAAGIDVDDDTPLGHHAADVALVGAEHADYVHGGWVNGGEIWIIALQGRLAGTLAG